LLPLGLQENKRAEEAIAKNKFFIFLNV